MAGYYAAGYTPPKGVTSREQVKKLQSLLGVKTDGVWGEKTEAAYRALGGGTASDSNSNTDSYTASTASNGNAGKYRFGTAGVRTAANSPLPVSTETVKNAKNAYASGDAGAIRSAQRALSYYDPSVTETGTFDAATKRAFANYGNRALYSGRYTDANGNSYTQYGTVQTGNAASPWRTEEERRSANNAHLARYGLSGETPYRLYDENGRAYDYGSLGADGMGGVYDPEGYSSNPYFLMATAGVARDQLTGEAKYASDKSIKMAVELDPSLLGRDLYVTNGGGISAQKTEGSISVKAIRNEVARLRGLESESRYGMGKAVNALPTPEYYAPVSASGNPAPSSGTSEFDALYASLAGRAGSSESTQNSTFSGLYERILSALLPEGTTSSAGSYSGASSYYASSYPSTSELSAQLSAILRPEVDSAIAAREKASEQNRAELAADAASRGMGSSTFVSSLAEREAADAQSDIALLESRYQSALAERLYEAMENRLDREWEYYRYEDEKRQEARETALKTAAELYEAEREAEETSSKKSGKSKSSGAYTGRLLSKSEYYEYLSNLSSEEKELLRRGEGKTWKACRAELAAAFGESGLKKLLGK